MNDKFSLYQTDGLWGIIENTSNEKQTSIKSYFGSDLIIKRLNEQAEQIDQLKQQLAEKDKEINQLKQEKKNAGEEKERAYLDTLTKPKIIELCLQYINDKNIAEQQLEALMLEISKQEVEQNDLPDYCTRTGTDCTNLGKIVELQQQLAEKDKEIELLKHLGNHEITVEMFKENTKLIIEKRQFAISELEKVKKLTENLLEKFCNSWEYNQKYMRGHRHIEYYDLIQGIDNQIKELKGE